jgi:hypothetical protein
MRRGNVSDKQNGTLENAWGYGFAADFAVELVGTTITR